MKEKIAKLKLETKYHKSKTELRKAKKADRRFGALPTINIGKVKKRKQGKTIRRKGGIHLF